MTETVSLHLRVDLNTVITQTRNHSALLILRYSFRTVPLKQEKLCHENPGDCNEAIFRFIPTGLARLPELMVRSP